MLFGKRSDFVKIDQRVFFTNSLTGANTWESPTEAMRAAGQLLVEQKRFTLSKSNVKRS